MSSKVIAISFFVLRKKFWTLNFDTIVLFVIVLIYGDKIHHLFFVTILSLILLDSYTSVVCFVFFFNKLKETAKKRTKSFCQIDLSYLLVRLFWRAWWASQAFSCYVSVYLSQ